MKNKIISKDVALSLLEQRMKEAIPFVTRDVLSTTKVIKNNEVVEENIEYSDIYTVYDDSYTDFWNNEETRDVVKRQTKVKTNNAKIRLYLSEAYKEYGKKLNVTYEEFIAFFPNLRSPEQIVKVIKKFRPLHQFTNLHLIKKSIKSFEDLEEARTDDNAITKRAVFRRTKRYAAKLVKTHGDCINRGQIRNINTF